MNRIYLAGDQSIIMRRCLPLIWDPRYYWNAHLKPTMRWSGFWMWFGQSDDVEWIPYDGWGMIENPGKKSQELRWRMWRSMRSLLWNSTWI